LSLEASGPPTAAPGTTVPISLSVANTGSGHDFPSGFPEGRIGWLAVHAYDLATGKELAIQDSEWKRTSIGVGSLTTEELVDPAFPKCNWKLPPGSADPYSIQFKAVASLGDGCPTLDLPYATPLNLKTNDQGLPIDAKGNVIDASHNPTGLEQFADRDGDGEVFDDSFLTDTRLRPMPHPGATRKVDRYSVVIPAGTRGPIAVSTAVYYQSMEAIVAQKFLGNMTDTNNNMVLEPCVVGGRCDGRKPQTEPAVVEGAPPVPMAVRNFTIAITGAPADTAPPKIGVYPSPGAPRAHLDTVPKVFFSRPVTGVNNATFTLTDAGGTTLPAWVDPIGDGTWGLFANQIQYKPGATYTAHLAAGICDAAAPTTCTHDAVEWSFTIAADADASDGDSSVPLGFRGADRPAPHATAHAAAEPVRPAAATARAAAAAARAAAATKAPTPATKAPAARPAAPAKAPAKAPAAKP
ncbi:MAG TPA: Ig-like domain-containing protein, partial [Kofleriaceae bacterium]|nr:Ig-like domain-containing protein [Kofleriaceae bacterium]